MVQVGPNEPAVETQPVQAEPIASDASATPLETEGTTLQPPQTVLERAQDNPLLPSLLLFGGILLMILVLFRALRKKTRVRQLQKFHDGSPAQRIANIHERAQSSMQTSDKLMLDAESVARRLGAQLDNKGARLELLLEEADSKLEQLNRLLAAADRSTPKSDPLTFDPSAPEVRVPRSIDPSVLDRARIDQDREERAAPPTSTGSAQDHINERILRLADDGLGCVEIARSLNQPVGQVELVLNLRKTS